MLPDDVENSPIEPVTAQRWENGLTPLEQLPAEPLSPIPPVKAREPFWGYSDLFLVLGLLFGSIFLIVAAVGVIAIAKPSLRSDPGPLLLPTQIALYVLLYLSFWLVFKTRYNKPVLESLGWRRTHSNLALVSGGGIALAFALSGLAQLMHTPKIPSPFDQLTASRATLVLFAIMAVTIAPLFEEMLFRGFVQPLLSRTLGAVAGVLVTAVLFGALHAPEYSWAWQYALSVALAGAVFGWLRARTGSIIPSTVMHGCFNAVSVAALVATKHF